jgi:predicted anti-sigma-YlaC factor YlaD
MGFRATCKEVHRLTSEGLDRDLTVVEQARIRMHLPICAGCRNFGNQMQLLRQAMRQFDVSKTTGKEDK